MSKPTVVKPVYKHYIFLKDWDSMKGTKVGKGVVLRSTDFEYSKNCVSIKGSYTFVNIPLCILKEFEPVKLVKNRVKKVVEKIEPKTQSESARISNKRI